MRLNRLWNEFKQQIIGYLLLCLVIMATFVTPLYVMAQAAIGAPEPSIPEVFAQVMKAIGDWKQIGWQAGLAGLLTFFISTLKNTMLRQLIWSKVPEWLKVFMAPFLAVCVFALGMGAAFDWKAFLAAITTGVAANYIHQMLDALKKAPFIGEKWQWLVDTIGKLLGKKQE